MKNPNAITFHAKKSFRGMVSVRSTIVDLARKKNLPIKLTCIDFPGEKMIITDLSEEAAHKISGPYQSKINEGEQFYLYDYIFEDIRD